MRVVLISTYSLGRQPFGLASPAAWLRRTRASVICLDLAVEPLDEEAIRNADLVALYLPMHTATRLATPLLGRLKALNPTAHLCCYGLYAPTNARFLGRLGVSTLLGGEYETELVRLVAELVRLVDRLRREIPRREVPRPEVAVSLARQRFETPDRTGLAGLSRYARLLIDGQERVVGFTEASRGCKHRCRHCPVVPVYGGAFRVVQRDVVLADIRQQVAAGAEHISFGDPDFFNGITHALRLVRSLKQEHPELTYDATIKVEHLLHYARHLPELRETGCLMVTTAVESIDDDVLKLLDKGHRREDFVRVVERCRQVGICLHPTFIPFNPWTSVSGFQDLLALLAELDLIDHVAPIQLAIRLLIPPGSLLLELPEVLQLVEPLHEEALVYPWHHEDPAVDALQGDVQSLVARATSSGESRRQIFPQIWRLAEEAPGGEERPRAPWAGVRQRVAVPYLNEPWYC